MSSLQKRKTDFLSSEEIDALLQAVDKHDEIESKKDKFFKIQEISNDSSITLMNVFNKSIEVALKSIIDIIDNQKKYLHELTNQDRLEVDMIIKMYNELTIGIKNFSIIKLPNFIKEEIHTIDHNLELFRSHGEYSQIAFDLHNILFKTYYVLHDTIEYYIEYEYELEENT